MSNLWESFRANRKPQYGRLPDSAEDELDLGDEEMLMEDEAEELDGDNLYDEPPVSTLPHRGGGSQSTPVPRLASPPAAAEGALLGEEFTSPHCLSSAKKRGGGHSAAD